VIGAVTATTTADGAFTLRLANGTYPVTVSATGYDPLTTSLVVGGPVGNLTYTLSPVPVVRVTGRVVDAQTLRPLSSVPVFFFGAYGSEGTTNTTSNGSFALLAPVGLDYVTASPPNGYQPYAEHVAVPPTGRTGLVIGLPPAGGGFDLRLLLVPVGASVLALVAIGVWAAE
ncbi:MAG: hypothetical protein L3J91_03895, partial [Thermoplasmata archaeon]|nr:hypothetical protein [Thermoplasmata archaeon]